LTSTTGEAGNHTGAQHAVEALFDAGDIFLRHRTANHLGFEFETLAGLIGLDDELDPRELARTTGLLLVGVVDFRALGDALTERHLGRADIGINLVGPAQDVDLDVEMEFAHALENGLAGLQVGRDPK